MCNFVSFNIHVLDATFRLLGILFHRISLKPTAAVAGSRTGANQTSNESAQESLCSLLVFHLYSKSATQKTCAGHVLREWVRRSSFTTWPLGLLQALHFSLVEVVYFDEMAHPFSQVQKESRALVAALQEEKVNIGNHFPEFRLESINFLK